jgi:hypothetical protein
LSKPQGRIDDEGENETVESVYRLSVDDPTPGGRPEVPVEVEEHKIDRSTELGEVGQVLLPEG